MELRQTLAVLLGRDIAPREPLAEERLGGALVQSAASAPSAAERDDEQRDHGDPQEREDEEPRPRVRARPRHQHRYHLPNRSRLIVRSAAPAVVGLRETLRVLPRDNA